MDATNTEDIIVPSTIFASNSLTETSIGEENDVKPCYTTSICSDNTTTTATTITNSNNTNLNLLNIQNTLLCETSLLLHHQQQQFNEGQYQAFNYIDNTNSTNTSALSSPISANSLNFIDNNNNNTFFNNKSYFAMYSPSLLTQQQQHSLAILNENEAQKRKKVK